MSRLKIVCHDETYGRRPTTAKSISAHVQGFSKRDVFGFYKIIGNSFCKIEQFYGSQFYPFPRAIARVFSKIFPTFSRMLLAPAICI